MAIFKCKMCGGTLEINENQSVATCDYCGMQQTLPKLDDEKRANMYDRANHFRRNNEFDKAMSIYEQILSEDNTDAEAYWSLVLCHYGIEYVEDPSTHKRVPTVNRAQFTSIFDDDNYKSAIANADMYQKIVYEEEAKAINEIQKGILAISQKEEPFDVFICYKETDSNGRRTQDSVLANDLYYQLKNEGFKVFFSRITLEDKIGSAYEPYIFAALNSAKVMVVLGTKPEFFNAVWVKNEWSRYLALVKQSKGKKVLIPAYRDMDPYDLPQEFSHLQAQDMSKLGFMQDLIRGIKKIAPLSKPETTQKETVVVGGGTANAAPLLQRAFMFIEDGDWESADEYCEKVLDIEPQNARAYLGKLMIDIKCKKKELLKEQDRPFDNNANYQKAYRFADEKFKAELAEIIEFINNRNENNRLASIYARAMSLLDNATTYHDYDEAAKVFETIPNWKDAKQKATECHEKSDSIKDDVYDRAMAASEEKTIESLSSAISLFEQILIWKDAETLLNGCRNELSQERIYVEAKAKLANATTYKDCISAEEAFTSIEGWKDSLLLAREAGAKAETIRDDIYYRAKSLMDEFDIEKIKTSISLFKSIPGWRDSDELISSCNKKLAEVEAVEAAYRQAQRDMNYGTLARMEAAKKFFDTNSGYKNCQELARTCALKIEEKNKALAIQAEKKKKAKKITIISLSSIAAIAVVIVLLVTLIIPTIQYNNALGLMEEGKYNNARQILVSLDGFNESEGKIAIIDSMDEINDKDYDTAIKNILSANEKVNIKYNFNGGSSSSSDSITLNTLSEYSSLITPQKEGYRFVEWDLEGYSYSKDNSIQINVSAVWTDGHFITYELNGGIANNPSIYHKDGAAVTLNNPTRDGYTFIGWTGTDLTDLTMNVTIPAGSYGDREFTANWEANEYTFTLNANGGKVSQTTLKADYDSNYTLPTPTKDYYTFAGWYDGSTKYDNNTWKKAANVTLTAKWTPISYSITYNLNGGTNSSQNTNSFTVESSKITLKDATKKGYTFKGWYSDSGLTSKVTEIGSGSHSNVTLYAKWEIINYTITYNLNGGTISGTQKTTFTVNDLPLSLPTPNKTGMTFLNWSKGTFDGESISKITDIGNITVVASYMDPNLKLKLSNDSSYYIVTDYASSGSASVLDIPAYYNGKPIKEIGSSAFSSCTTLVTINIPSTVNKIGSSAFSGCKNLKNVNIPNGVTSIPGYAFQRCESLVSIALPNSIESIGTWAFYDCESLVNINLPSSLKKIDDVAFAHCSSLKSVVIPKSVTVIQGQVFSDCTNLESVTLHEGLLSIEAFAFEACYSLKKIIIPQSVTTISGLSTFSGCSSLTIYCRRQVIPDGWESGWNGSRPVVWGYTGN